MISREVRRLIDTGSAIRRMWADGIRLKEQHGADKVADLTLGNPVALPPPEFQRALEEVVAHPPPGLHRYTPNAGHPEVRARVAAHLDSAGILPGARAEHVTMTSGAGAALNVALRALLDPGDEVIVLPPYFPDYPAHVANHQGVLVPVSTDAEFLPDLAAIEAAIGPRTRVVIVNHPNNPSGREYPDDRIEALADLLRDATRRNDRPVWLLSDEPYREVRYLDGRFTSPSVLYEFGLMCYSYSKSLSIPGERIGYLAVNPECPGAAEAAAAFSVANRILGFTNAPALWQHVVSRCPDAAIDLTELTRHRDRLLEALRRGGFHVREPEGTFYLFPRTPGGDDRAFVRRLMEDLVLVVPGGTFGWPGHFRIAYCTDDRTVDLAVARFARGENS